MTHLFYKILFFSLFFLFQGYAQAQDLTISGKVISGSDRLPIPGVSVLNQKGFPNTVTDANGNFTVHTSKGSVLTFTFIGFLSKSVTVTDASPLSITLSENVKGLNEVVVVAFGSQKREEITGSVQELKAKDITSLQNGNILQGLGGKVAGVQVFTTGQPGSAATIRMRGIGSINASSDPLIVLDGIPYDGSLNSISKSDIETLSFLEDASSNALYGSRGANGVIIVTTKKGKGQGLQIEADVKAGINFRATPDYSILKSPKDYYLAYYNRARIGEIVRVQKGGSVTSSPRQVALNSMKSTLGYNAYDVPFEQLINDNGSFNDAANLRYQDDWAKLLFRTAFRQEASLGLSANSENLKSYTSFNYLNDKGYLIASGFKRLGLRSNLVYDLSKSLKIGSNLSYAYTSQDFGESGGFSNPFQFARNIAPFYPVYLRDNDFQRVYDAKGRPVYDYGSGKGPFGASRSYAVFENPVGNRQYDKDNTSNNQVNANLFLNYKFLNDFEFTYNFGANVDNTRRLVFGNTYGGTSSSAGGSLSRTSLYKYNLNHQQLLNYTKKIDKHSIAVLLGHELNKTVSDQFAGSKQQLLLPDLLVFDNAAKITGLSGSQYGYAVEGYFSRLVYSYNNRYFFNASIRRDGSSVFAPESRWGTFYGLGGAWDIAKEDFLSENKIVNSLKLKVSYGQQGNDNVTLSSGARDYYAYYDTYSINDFGDNTPVVSLNKLGNRDLKWETSKNLNAGFEASLFDRRLTVNAEYFERKVSNMIYAQALPPSNAGSYARFANIGDMNNKGIQLSLAADLVRTADINWSVTANATHYNNKITRLPDAQKATGLVSGSFILKEGGDRYAYYLREFAGVDPKNGDALWFTDQLNASTGQTEKQITNDYSKATVYNIGKSAIPKVYGGFGTAFSYKNVSLSANFAYQFGGYGFDDIYRSLLHSDNYASNYHTDVNNSWTPENPGAALPRVDLTSANQNASSTLYLIKSDYISLQDISLSYDFAKERLKWSGLAGARVYVTGNNLYLWSKRKGYDPRTSLTGLSYAYTYPLLSSVSIGVNLKF
jgi:TonB-linked SusC/RagA family outer membrane protein